MEEVTSICKQLVSWLAELILWQSMKKWLLLYIYTCIYIIKKALLRESDGQVNCVLGIIILVLPTSVILAHLQSRMTYCNYSLDVMNHPSWKKYCVHVFYLAVFSTSLFCWKRLPLNEVHRLMPFISV